MRKKLGAVSGSMILLMLIGFVLPWVEVSCAGQPMITQNGLQVLAGDISSAMPQDPTSETTTEPQDTTEPSSTGRASQSDVDPAWWLVLVLLGGIAGGVGGLMALGRARKPGLMATVGSGVAAATLTLSLIVGFPIDNKLQEANEGMKQLGDMDSSEDSSGGLTTDSGFSPQFQTELKYGVWIALLAVWIQLGAGIGLLKQKPPLRMGPGMPPPPRPGGGQQPYGHAHPAGPAPQRVPYPGQQPAGGQMPQQRPMQPGQARPLPPQRPGQPQAPRQPRGPGQRPPG
ncbi:MAG: hypothetical protein ACYTDT_07150 [Planctomycetota bacterium]|jgi:hypothetical protein